MDILARALLLAVAVASIHQAKGKWDTGHRSPQLRTLAELTARRYALALGFNYTSMKVDMASSRC